MQLNEHRLDREREKIERGMERELDCWDPVRNTRLSISGRVRWMMSVVYCGSEWSWLVWRIDGGVMPAVSISQCGVGRTPLLPRVQE